jgi:2-haloacid dehalogenase
MKPVLVFDLNGTLTDLSQLDALFEQAFGAAALRREWFTELIQLAMASTITGYHAEFSKLASAALETIARREGKPLDEARRSAILQAARQVPVFADVVPGLEQLRKAGFRLVLLTNSGRETAESTLSAAGIRAQFEKVLSVDGVQKYKPAAEVYRMAARELGVGVTSIMMVAAHAWDTTGAIRAGCEAAFLERPGEVLGPLDPRPRVIARDLHDLAAQLVSAEAA